MLEFAQALALLQSVIPPSTPPPSSPGQGTGDGSSHTPRPSCGYSGPAALPCWAAPPTRPQNLGPCITGIASPVVEHGLKSEERASEWSLVSLGQAESRWHRAGWPAPETLLLALGRQACVLQAALRLTPYRNMLSNGAPFVTPEAPNLSHLSSYLLICSQFQFPTAGRWTPSFHAEFNLSHPLNLPALYENIYHSPLTL